MIVTEKSTSLTTTDAREKRWQAVLVGEGGTGKTTLAALLSLYAVREGEQVLAVDADPETGLAGSLGVPLERSRSLIPLSRNNAYIQEKIPANTDLTAKPMFIPDVEDVIERFAIPVQDRLRLLVLGNVEIPVSRCRCPEHALVAAIFRYLVHRNRDAMIFDTGGIHPPEELFGGSSLHALIVTKPTFNSLRIAEHITRQLLDRGVLHLHLVVNGMGSEKDVTKVKQFTTGLTCYEHVFSLPHDETIRYMDPDLSELFGEKSIFMDAVGKMFRALQESPIS
jgi:CO dehydrogenase maturation factor